MPAVRGVGDERTYLYEIIQTIGSGPDLETILHGIVHLVSEATACHACFVYLTEDDVLILHAASRMYAHLEGKVRINVGEGLTGWVAKTRRSAFIKERALEDPRVRRAYFPELGDEHYQSLVSVPIFARAGEVIGVITLHAEAPREFARRDLEFLEHTASLIAGAAENARLYEDAQARVILLTELSKLSQAIASAGDIRELLRTVVAGCRRALGAERCEIYLLDSSERLRLSAASPERLGPTSLDPRRLWLDALRAGQVPLGGEEAERLTAVLWGEGCRGTPLVVPLAVGDEHLGLIVTQTTTRPRDAERALRALASHTAVAIKQHQLIDGLKEAHLVKDLFEALSRGRGSAEEIEAQATSLGCHLDLPHTALHLVPSDIRAPLARRRGRRPRVVREPEQVPWQELAGRVESGLSQRFPGALFDRRERWVRGLLPMGERTPEQVTDEVRQVLEAATGGEPRALSVGLSGVCRRSAESFRSGLDEAASAAEVGALIRGEPGVTTYDDLGPYRYILTSDEGVRDRYQQHLERLADYDRRRGARLFETLEAYLDRRGNIAATARALYIHPNTLRQRLSRIHRVAGLSLEREDWLSLAIAIKVVRLREMRRSARREGGEQDG